MFNKLIYDDLKNINKTIKIANEVKKLSIDEQFLLFSILANERKLDISKTEELKEYFDLLFDDIFNSMCDLCF